MIAKMNGFKRQGKVFRVAERVERLSLSGCKCCLTLVALFCRSHKHEIIDVSDSFGEVWKLSSSIT